MKTPISVEETIKSLKKSRESLSKLLKELDTVIEEVEMADLAGINNLDEEFRIKTKRIEWKILFELLKNLSSDVGKAKKLLRDQIRELEETAEEVDRADIFNEMTSR